MIRKVITGAEMVGQMNRCGTRRQPPVISVKGFTPNCTSAELNAVTARCQQMGLDTEM